MKMLILIDMAGAAGHRVCKGSIVMNEPTFNALMSAIDSLNDLDKSTNISLLILLRDGKARL